jgi:hypothetical protein
MLHISSYLVCARIDRFLEVLRNGEQQQIQKIVSSFSDRSTGKWEKVVD